MQKLQLRGKCHTVPGALHDARTYALGHRGSCAGRRLHRGSAGRKSTPGAAHAAGRAGHDPRCRRPGRFLLLRHRCRSRCPRRTARRPAGSDASGHCRRPGDGDCGLGGRLRRKRRASARNPPRGRVWFPRAHGRLAQAHRRRHPRGRAQPCDGDVGHVHAGRHGAVDGDRDMDSGLDWMARAVVRQCRHRPALRVRLRMGRIAAALAQPCGDGRGLRRRRGACNAGPARTLALRCLLRAVLDPMAGVDGVAADLHDRDARTLAHRSRSARCARCPQYRGRLGCRRLVHAPRDCALAPDRDCLCRDGRVRGVHLRALYSRGHQDSARYRIRPGGRHAARRLSRGGRGACSRPGPGRDGERLRGAGRRTRQRARPTGACRRDDHVRGAGMRHGGR